MRNHRSSFGVFVLALGIAALPGCGKLKERLGMSKGADGGAASAQAANGSVPSLDGFEGEITLLVKPGPKEHSSKAIPPLNLLVKSGKFRIDVPADTEELKSIGRVYVVVAASEKKISVVLDDKKEVVVINLDKIGEEMKGFSRGHEGTPAAPKVPPKVVKTGRKDTVAGYSCEDWDIVPSDGSRSKASVCIAERAASWFSLPTLGLPAEYKFIAEMLDGRHFPLRVIGYENDGSEGGLLEVTKLDQKPLSAQLFEIPASYRVVDVQQAIQEIMAGAMAAGRGGPVAVPGVPKPAAVAPKPAAAAPKHK
jgi:hypothetical protein